MEKIKAKGRTKAEFAKDQDKIFNVSIVTRNGSISCDYDVRNNF